jgi:hypothetical protein
MTIFTIEEFARDFLRERRLSAEEVEAVIKITRNDSSLGHVLWDAHVAEVPHRLLLELRKVLRTKVICWMNKYRPSHPARCLFMGESR